MALAQRLANLGVAAFMLKYRTIESPDDAMHMPAAHIEEMTLLMDRAETGQPAEIPVFAGEPGAVKDGSRAMTLLRDNAAEWGINPSRIGMIGFSSGAFLAADLAIGDPATRPAFVALIYGGLRGPVPADASPAFIAAAADDPFLPDDSLRIYSAWKKVGASAELHVYEQGGHGFGLTPRRLTSDHWYEHLVSWMQMHQLIHPAKGNGQTSP